MGACASVAAPLDAAVAETATANTEDAPPMEFVNDFTGAVLAFEKDEVIGDKYCVHERLPLGTLGISYLATPVGGDTVSVLKVVPALRDSAITNALRVAQKQLIKLQHANVVPVLDILEDQQEENMIIVSPLVARGNVAPLQGRMLLQPNEKPENSVLMQLVRDVGVGLRVLHSHSVFHMNLHPNNVFQLKTGSFAIGDGGVDLLVSTAPVEKLFKLRRQGMLAPEVLRGDPNPIKAKLDVWSFGVFMFNMVFGSDPFPWGDTPAQTAAIICDPGVKMTIPSDAKRNLPPDFLEVLQWTLEKNASDRPIVSKLLRHPFFRCSTSQSFFRYSSGGALTAKSNPGRFVIEKVLGKGTHAETMLVSSPQFPEKHIVLKTFMKSLEERFGTCNADELKKIKTMVVLSKKITHHNVAHYIEVVSADSKISTGLKESFATVEYFPSGVVSVMYPQVMNGPGAGIIDMLQDVIRGCIALRDQGMYHGNLKPSNVCRHSKRFVIADFGPLMRAPHEFFDAEGDCVLDLPHQVVECLRGRYGFEKVDAFAIGLLAASFNPALRAIVWEAYCKQASEKLSQEKIASVLKQSPDVTHEYVEFVQLALSGEATLDSLASHTLIGMSLPLAGASPPTVSVEERDLRGWVRARFNHDAEKNVTDVLGPLAFHCMTPQNNYFDGGGRSASAISVESAEDIQEEQQITLNFVEVLRCQQCLLQIKVVLFRCPVCADYYRCGKCASIDNHGHKLVPLVVRKVLPADSDDFDSTRKQSVLMPTSHFTSHGLQELEMAADLPSGVLTGPSATPKSKSLSSARLVPTGRKGLQQQMQERRLLSEAEAKSDLSVEGIVREAIANRASEVLLDNFDLECIPKRLLDPPLTTVRYLDLAHNHLREISHDISYLTCLEKLVLGHNELTELPEAIGELSELLHLDVSHNMLTDLPPTLMFAEKLESIAMDYNQCAEIPGVICDMPWLTTVYLAENHDIKCFLSIHDLQRLGELKLGLDNEPDLWEQYKQIEPMIPRITMMWNKVYPDPIVPGIYCGSLRSAQNLHVYKRLSIGYLLTVGRGLEPSLCEGMKHRTVIVDDIVGATIDSSFDEAIEFIDEAQQAGSGCLVHCFAGMSRSATTVIAYLMKRRGMRLDEAYLTTKRGRPAIYPNAGFFTQLLNYDAKLFPDGRPLDIESMERDKVPLA